MTADPHPRYVCLHYKQSAGARPEAGSSYVLDTWYCYGEVARYEGYVAYDTHRHRNRFVTARELATRRAAEWNAEHDAWLARS